MDAHSLSLLTELALTARDAAAARRAQFQQRLQQAREQLDVLRHYARDYVQRSRDQLAQGCDPAAQLNWRAFAAKLDQAIESQATEVRAREQQLLHGEDELQQAMKRVKSLQTLAERRQDAAQAAANRIDQKLTDEIARTAGARRQSTTTW